MEANTSHDTNSSGGKETKRQQFSNKQRMDMYAFCVLELEMHSNKVSIKKQQMAIQKVLHEQQKEGVKNQQPQPQDINHSPTSTQVQQQTLQTDQEPLPTPTTALESLEPLVPMQQRETHQLQQNGSTTLESVNNDQVYNNHSNCSQSSGVEGKTLLQLQQEVAMTRKCYSDYQKTQVLTSSMLRDVQKRFAKYYPDAAIPSRTTIKHVFEKCVAHGTVENIRTPRKNTKIPQGDEIEYLLIHEPQLSLRQMAQKLNVSTGTVSRRCKALGLVPESVTIKHQQLATARRQKQIKQLESQSKAAAASANLTNLTTLTATPATMIAPIDSTMTNGDHETITSGDFN